MCPDLEPFFQHKDELIVEAGCLMWGIRLVIPVKFGSTVLDKLHTTYTGIIQMKSSARMRVWWLSIDRYIKELVHGCEMCQSMQNISPPV